VFEPWRAYHALCGTFRDNRPRRVVKSTACAKRLHFSIPVENRNFQWGIAPFRIRLPLPTERGICGLVVPVRPQRPVDAT
jgi:hypothetical protein